VLAQRRGPPRRFGIGGPHRDDRFRPAHRTEVGRIRGEHGAVVDDLGVDQDVGHGIHRRARHVGRPQPVEYLVATQVSAGQIEGRGHPGVVAQPFDSGRVTGRELGGTDRRAERVPLHVGDRRAGEPAAVRAPDEVADPRRPPGQLLVDRRVGEGVVHHPLGPQEVHRRVQHRQHDLAALAGALAPEQGGEHALHDGQRGDLVRQERAHELGRVVAALPGHHRRHRLDDGVVDTVGHPRAVVAVTAHRGGDQPGVLGTQLGKVQSQAVGDARTEVLHRHVRARAQPPGGG
jgi:hypothetical protein